MTEFTFDLKLVLGAEENTYNEGVALSAATHLLPINNGAFSNSPDILERNNDRPHMGAKPKVPVRALGTISGEAENFVLSALPAAATDAAPLDLILKAMGLAKTVDLTPGAEKILYTPVSTGFSSIAFGIEQAAGFWQLNGSRGSGSIDVVIGQFLAISGLSLQGLDAPPIAAGALGVPSFIDGPLLVPDQHNTTFLFNGLTLDITEAKLLPNPTIGLKRGSESKKARVRTRAAQLTFIAYQDDLATFNPHTLFDNKTEVPWNCTVAEGVTGGRFKMYGPRAQVVNVEATNIDGDAAWSITCDLIPSALGNDEFTVEYDYVP